MWLKAEGGYRRRSPGPPPRTADRDRSRSQRPAQTHSGSINLIGQRQRFCEPKRAEQARRCPPRRQPVHSMVGAIAMHQPAVVGEPLLNRSNRGEHPWVSGRQKIHDRHHQVRGIQGGRVNALSEGARSLTPSVAYHSVPDPLALPLPAIAPETGSSATPRTPSDRRPLRSVGRTAGRGRRSQWWDIRLLRLD